MRNICFSHTLYNLCSIRNTVQQLRISTFVYLRILLWKFFWVLARNMKDRRRVTNKIFMNIIMYTHIISYPPKKFVFVCLLKKLFKTFNTTVAISQADKIWIIVLQLWNTNSVFKWCTRYFSYLQLIMGLQVAPNDIVQQNDSYIDWFLLLNNE